MARRIGTPNVKELAKAKGYSTYLRLAAAADIVGTTANRWWNNDRSLVRADLRVLLQLAEALDCEIGDILSFEEVPE